MAAQVDNNLILKEIRSFGSKVESMDGRIGKLEQWQTATMAAEAAIAKYKQENQPIGQRPTIFGDGVNKDMVRIIGQALIVITALVSLTAYIVQKLIT